MENPMDNFSKFSCLFLLWVTGWVILFWLLQCITTTWLPFLLLLAITIIYIWYFGEWLRKENETNAEKRMTVTIHKEK